PGAPAMGRSDLATTGGGFGDASTEADMARDQHASTRERLREQLHAGRLDGKTVELETRERSMPSFELIQGSSIEEIGVNLRDMMPGMFQGRTRTRKMPVPDAFDYLTQEEAQKLIDMDAVSRAALRRVEDAGIIFLDEIDKIAGREGAQGP